MNPEKCVTHQRAPLVIPAAGNKHIEEHFGLAAGGGKAVSVARMIAPPGWREPVQQPDFDEYILMVKGRQSVTVDGREYVVAAGESMRIAKGCRVRYSNPFDAPAEYWSVCLPAFSLETVHRGQD